jgi:Ala-tRNA(Pro) deacylase
MRIAQFLQDQQIDFETMYHPPAFSAQKRAKVLHVPGRFLVKSVLLALPRGHAVAVLPAPAHVDLARVGAHFGGTVRLACEDEVARWFLDCERGALTPFGRLYGLTTLLEESIPLAATIVFEAQLHVMAIRMYCHDFVRLEQPVRFAFSCTAPDRCALARAEGGSVE